MNKKKLGLVVAAAFVIAAIVTGIFALATREDKIREAGKSEVRITITDDGFSPSTVSIKRGTTVVWVNNTAAPHSIGSNPYPDASSLPGLKSEAIGPDDTYSYTFSTAGTYGYTDYTKPTVGGEIQVK